MVLGLVGRENIFVSYTKLLLELVMVCMLQYCEFIYLLNVQHLTEMLCAFYDFMFIFIPNGRFFLGWHNLFEN